MLVNGFDRILEDAAAGARDIEHTVFHSEDEEKFQKVTWLCDLGVARSTRSHKTQNGALFVQPAF